MLFTQICPKKFEGVIMIIVNCALRQDDIIEIVENLEIENKKVFKYVNKAGIRIFFECDYEDIRKACHIAKEAIYNTRVGKVLFYEVVDKEAYPWIKCE